MYKTLKCAKEDMNLKKLNNLNEQTHAVCVKKKLVAGYSKIINSPCSARRATRRDSARLIGRRGPLPRLGGGSAASGR